MADDYDSLYPIWGDIDGVDYKQTRETLASAIGKIISVVDIIPAGEDKWDEDSLFFVFTDGSQMRIYDAGQRCCERRMMHTDDNLANFRGSTFLCVENSMYGATEIESEYIDYSFLTIRTNWGIFTLANYDAHNGYYAGFILRAENTADNAAHGRMHSGGDR